MAKPVKTGENRNEKGQFKEGVSGNPKGKPRGTGISITTEIKRMLEKCPDGQKATYLQLLLNRILKKAIQEGDQQMITRIWNYVDGMPPQTIDTNLRAIDFDVAGLVKKAKDELSKQSTDNSKSDSEL